jgi:hypothetical protein
MTKRLTDTEKTMRANVRRGAALLDKYVPGWAEKIGDKMKAGQFVMSDPDRCVVGVLELGKGSGWTKYSNKPFIQLNGVTLCNWQETEQYGFYIPIDKYFNLGSDDPYEDLQKVWAAQVDKRVSA